ncbi:hypothetical protein [Pedobacter paludis]|nr:hypothetical protein [Pedobacter paludis]
MDVTVIGKTVPLADYWGEENVKFAKGEFKIDKSIMFNGGLYYLKRSVLTSDIYTTARKISKKYDEYGFHRIHGDWKNEEDLVSIGMISHGQLPIDDNGLFVTGISAFRKPKKLNVIKGLIFFEPKNNPHEHNSQLLIHFGGNNLNSFPYISQRILLQLNQLGFPTFLATLIVNLCINVPFHFLNYFRKKYKNPHSLLPKIN